MSGTAAGGGIAKLAAMVNPLTAVALVVGVAAGAGIHAVLAGSSPDQARSQPSLPAAAPPGISAPPMESLQPRVVSETPRRASASPEQPSSSTTRSVSTQRQGLRRGSGTTEAFAVERNLLEIARSALSRGRVADARRALEKHRRTYPSSRLGEERDALWILALAASGGQQAARAEADRFRRLYPDSLFLPSLDEALQQSRPGSGGEGAAAVPKSSPKPDQGPPSK